MCSWPERRFTIPSDHEALLIRDSLDNPPDPPGLQGIGDRLDLPQMEQVIPRQGHVLRAGTPFHRKGLLSQRHRRELDPCRAQASVGSALPAGRTRAPWSRTSPGPSHRCARRALPDLREAPPRSASGSNPGRGQAPLATVAGASTGWGRRWSCRGSAEVRRIFCPITLCANRPSRSTPHTVQIVSSSSTTPAKASPASSRVACSSRCAIPSSPPRQISTARSSGSNSQPRRAPLAW